VANSTHMHQVGRVASGRTVSRQAGSEAAAQAPAGSAKVALQRGDPGVQRQVARQLQAEQGNAAVARLAQEHEGEPGEGSEPLSVDAAFALATSGRSSRLPFAAELGPRLGLDLSRVKAYLGGPEAEAGLAALGAEAAAHGDQVAFRMASPSKELVAHEATHIAQQGGKPGATTGLTVSQPGDALERQAESTGRDLAAGKTPTGGTDDQAAGGSSLARAPGPADPIPVQIDTALAATPLKAGAVYKLIFHKDFASADRTILGQDATKMAKIAAAFAADGSNMAKAAIRLACTLADVIKWCMAANQASKLAEKHFQNRFAGATADEIVGLLADTEALTALINGQKTASPIKAASMVAAPDKTKALLTDPTGRSWALGVHGGLRNVFKAMVQAQKDAIKADAPTLAALLATPEAATEDLAQMLKNLGYKPIEAIPLLQTANSLVKLGMPPYPAWFCKEVTRADLEPFFAAPEFETLKSSAGPAIKPLEIESLKKSPGDFGTLLGAQPKFKEWILQAEGWPPLLKAVAKRLDAAMYGGLLAGSEWPTLVQDLYLQKKSGDTKGAEEVVTKLKKVMPPEHQVNLALLLGLHELKDKIDEALDEAEKAPGGPEVDAGGEAKALTPAEALEAQLAKPAPPPKELLAAVLALPEADRTTLAADDAKMSKIAALLGRGGQDVVKLAIDLKAALDQIVRWVQAAGQAAKLGNKPFVARVHDQATDVEVTAFVDKPELQTLIAAAGKAVKPLAIKDLTGSTAKMGALLGAKAAFRTWAVTVQTWGALLDYLAKQTDATLAAALIAGAEWNNLVKDIEQQRTAGDQTKARKALDALFAATPDGNLNELQQLFQARFGISVTSAQAANPANTKAMTEGNGKHERAWDAPALRRVYDSYKKLPPGQVESGKTEVATSYVTYDPVCPACGNDNSKDAAGNKVGQWGPNCSGGAAPCGAALDVTNNWSGFAYNATPHLSIQYDDQDIAKDETGGYTNNAKDLRRNTKLLDYTALHELGHRVDEGRKYTNKDQTFLDLAGWKAYPVGNAGGGADLAKKLRDKMGAPYGGGALTDPEKALVVDGAANALAAATRPKIVDDLKPHLQAAYTAKYGGLAAGMDGSKAYREFDNVAGTGLWSAAKTSNLYVQVAAGNEANSPWYTGEPFGRLNKGLQFHEGYGYEGCWWAYKTTAWSTKISLYQFRCPADHFAELYALWWVTATPGDKVKGKARDWFKSKNLHKDG